MAGIDDDSHVSPAEEGEDGRFKPAAPRWLPGKAGRA